MQGNNDGECRLSSGAFEDFGEFNDGLLLGVAELVKRGFRRWVGEGLCQGLRCDDGCIDGGCFGHWALHDALPILRYNPMPSSQREP